MYICNWYFSSISSNVYGCEYSINSQFCQDKVKTTNFERYGCENVFQSDIIKKKIKQTNLEKYGVENYAQTNEFTKYQKNIASKYLWINYMKSKVVEIRNIKCNLSAEKLADLLNGLLETFIF